MTTVKTKMKQTNQLDILEIMMDVNKYSEIGKHELLQSNFENSINELHDLGFRVCDKCRNPIVEGHYNEDTSEHLCETCANEVYTKEEIEELWNEHIETDYNGGMYWTDWTS